MSKFLKSVLTIVFAAQLVLIGAAGLAVAGKYGLGREAMPEEVAAWDTDVRPDGAGLPKGEGSVADGEKIYGEQCAACHGDFGEGIDRWPVLVGGQGSIGGHDPVKTIGSYWPYASTIYDYTYRAMPFGNARSLTPNEVYALTAYLLYMNDVVTDDKFVLSDKNFASVRMPNEKNFTDDVRPDTPLVASQKPCMENCKADVTITGRAMVLDVTPESTTNLKAAE